MGISGRRPRKPRNLPTKKRVLASPGGLAGLSVIIASMLGSGCSSVALSDEENGIASPDVADTSATSTTQDPASSAADTPDRESEIDSDGTMEREPNDVETDGVETDGVGETTVDGTADTEVDEAEPDKMTLIGKLTFTVQVVHPHDPTMFTQGLAFHNGQLVESSGLYGESNVQRYTPGDLQPSEATDLDETEFGGGIDVVNDALIQLTWQEGTAHLRDLDTLESSSTFSYEGEGWGLCYEETSIITSDGTDVLSFRDPTTFDRISSVSVTRDGQPVLNINELECVNGFVWANVWLSNEIIRIDPTSGDVVAWVDLSELVPQGLTANDVLNGIAYSPGDDTYFVTGKRWSDLYQISIDP